MPASSSRNPGLDLARNLAIFLVIVQHLVFLGGLSNDGMSASHRLQARFLEAVSQSCVDLFGLLSGYLGVTAFGWNGRRIVRLWLQVWSTGLLVLSVCAGAVLLLPSVFGPLPTGADWLTAALPVWHNEYWYFTAYCLVFLLAPLLNRFLFAPGGERRGFFTAGFLFAAVCGLTFLPGGVDLLPLEKGYSGAWLVCLYVFGAALRRWPGRLPSAPVCFALAALGVGVTVSQRLLMASLPALKALFADEWTLHHYTSPTVTFVAGALLIGCARLSPSLFTGWIGRLNAALAPCAFGIYLIHVQPFLFDTGFKSGWTWLDRAPDGLFAVAVLGTALVLYLLIAGVEKVRQFLFRRIFG